MTTMVPTSLYRWQLLAGTSLLVLGAPQSAEACITVVAPGTIISSSTSCINWTGSGTLVINSGTIVGTATPAVSVSITSGTLTNSGIIHGSEYGVDNASGSTLTQLLNNGGGTITADYSAAIRNNSGSIGTLNNSGLITITNGYGVENHGTIDSVVNTGRIGSNSFAIYNMSGGSIGTVTNGSIGTISGGTKGIDNRGTIGAINNNSGAITGGVTGIVNYIPASGIGALTNSGTITGGTNGINNGGTIGTLTNSGEISSGNYGIQNTGTIGSINNSSLISGGSDGILNNGGSIGILTNTGTIADNFVAAIYNASGTIGTLSNSSGTISGVVGIANIGGTIDTIINGGVISGNSIGIYNLGGRVGTLTNSGTISGSSYAINIDSESTFGPIANAGLIAGNIANASSNNLSINGGSGSTFGTLTGSSQGIGSADRGTITNTASNVVFSFGNLLLNDNINASGHTVTNSGATLRLVNAIAITGIYNQTGGGLLISAANGGASYGYLTVSSNATVSNSTVTISGAGLSIGQSYTIVRSGATGSYTNDTAMVAVTSGLAATITTVGQNLVVSLVAGESGGSDNGGGGSSGDNSGGGGNSATTTVYTARGLATGGVAASIGTVLDRINQDTSPQAVIFQNDVLAVINALPSAQQGAAIKQLAPTQNVPSAQMSSNAATAVLGAVEQHQQTAMAYDPATGMAAGSDAHDSAFWGQILGGGARRDSNAQADGYSLADFGLATGMDHRFTPNAMGGVALSWVRAWSSGSAGSSGSSSILDSYQLTFYGTYRLDRAFVDGQLGVGWNHFDQKRAVSFLGSMASASYDGQQYLAKAMGGYDLSLGKTTLTPLAGLRWLRAVNESYTESGAGAANLSIRRRGINGLSQDLGGKASWSFATGLGTLKPEARVTWVHDYTQGPIGTSGLMGGETFAVATPRTVADGARVGLAATLNGDDALSFRAEYEAELRHQYQGHTGIIKVVWGF